MVDTLSSGGSWLCQCEFNSHRPHHFYFLNDFNDPVAKASGFFIFIQTFIQKARLAKHKLQ